MLSEQQVREEALALIQDIKSVLDLACICSDGGLDTIKCEGCRIDIENVLIKISIFLQKAEADN